MRIRRQMYLVLAFILMCGATVHAQFEEDDGYAAQRDAMANAATRQLAEREPLIRQGAAETLANLSAVEHRRMVEGYRLQEKNERVRLALDWALYRMGKREALYSVVRELRSTSRQPQAVGYLSQLESPQLLHPFFEHADEKTIAGLLDVMARIGDAESLEIIKPHTSSLSTRIAEAAQFAEREITSRLAQEPPDVLKRPRQVGKADSTSP
jgi:hypothetical protein